MLTAADYFEELMQIPPISSGFPMLDELLEGGFISGPVHFLYGPRTMLNTILMQTAVNFFQTIPQSPQKLSELTPKVAYIDGENRFNPYLLSKFAVAQRFNPINILKQITVARAFTWSQMLEILEEKVKNLKDIKLILVSGMTGMFEELIKPSSSNPKVLDQKPFQDLNRMFAGLKAITAENNPIIILTGPLHSKSKYRPAGGRLFSHFCGVIAGIHETERYIDLVLEQHPFLPNRKKRLWKSILDRKLSPSKKQLVSEALHNHTLDSFIH